MSFVDAITRTSERVLRERTFELVVAPAIADLQFDVTATGLRRLRNAAAVLSAFSWGLYEDVLDSSALLTFAVLVLIPAAYYSLLVAICLPRVHLLSTTTQRLAVGGIILVLSLGPVVACYWPDRHGRRISPEAP